MSPPGPEGRASLVDARGCLTPAGFAALARAPLGRAPAELAAHVSSCGRCQERLLAGGASPRGSPASTPPRKPRVWLGVTLVFAALLLALVALVLASRLH
jgi:hypothetical protein